jgi:hypothetical protein
MYTNFAGVQLQVRVRPNQVILFFYIAGPLAYKKHSDPAGDLTKLQKGWHTLVLKT